MAITTYGDISQRTADWAASVMLKHAEPILCLNLFGQTKPIPRNRASSAKFRRPVPFLPATTPLQEGVTPQSHKITYEDVRVQLQQFGDLVEITDWVNDMSEDPVLSDVIMLSGEQAAATEEELLWGVLKAGTNKFYATGNVRTAVNGVITLNKLHQVIRNLNANKAQMVTQILDGSSNTMTRPIEAAYPVFGHTDLEHDIRALPNFTPVAQYGSRKPIHQRELGSVENLRFILSPVLKPYPNAGAAKAGIGTPAQPVLSTAGVNADVYPMIVATRDYYAVCPLAGKGSVKPTVLNPGTPSKSDPLGQRGYVGWKTFWAGVILNEAWGAVIEVAASEL